MSTESPGDVTTRGAPAAAHSTLGRLRARLDAILNRYPYPPLGPSPRGPLAIAALVVVALMAVAFAGFFIADVALHQAAFQTHAEDLGIYDQAMWNATRGLGTGGFFHQTICDVIGDTNCLGDIPRTAIHFEPILLLVAPFYALIPSPLTLVVIQALVVAAGAFPAHWLASRRLGTPLAGVAFAALYLAFPALQAALSVDFHAVTLAAAFILFALYCMLARNDVGLWIACALAMTTKEEVPLVVIMIGLSVWLLQRRTRLGLTLVGVAAAYFGFALLVIHFSSPIGHSSTLSRYGYLGAGPLKAASFILTHPLLVLRQYLFAPDRIAYLRKLLAPTGYLALLSPLTLLIAAPELAVNMLSTDPTMYSGLYQYNAVIVPVLVAASIESVAMLAAVARWYVANLPAAFTRGAASRVTRAVPGVVLAAVMLFTLGMGVRSARRSDLLSTASGFHWPRVTAHDDIGASLLKLIPPNASVSAQSDLVPHVSERRDVFLFPDHAASADYVFLDVTGNIFPLQNTPSAFPLDVLRLLGDGQHRIVAARDGYLLLARGTPASSVATLPNSFYTFAHTSSAPAHALDVRFGPAVRLVGYDIWPGGTINLGITGMTITTYWRVAPQVSAATVPQVVLFPADEPPQEITDLPTVQFLPPQKWAPDQTYVVATRSIIPAGGATSIGIGARAVVLGSSGNQTSLPAAVSATTSPTPTVDAATGAVIFATVPVLP